MTRLTEHLTVDHGVRLPPRRSAVAVTLLRIRVGSAWLTLSRMFGGGR